MNRLLLATLPLLIVSPAFAQEATGGNPAGNWNASQTKADAEARAAMLFGRLDTSRDGFITQDEVDQFGKAMAQQMGGENRMGGRMARMMAEADADHDGKVSLAEAKANADARFDAADANHDGTVTPEERQARTATGGQPPHQ